MEEVSQIQQQNDFSDLSLRKLKQIITGISLSPSIVMRAIENFWDDQMDEIKFFEEHHPWVELRFGFAAYLEQRLQICKNNRCEQKRIKILEDALAQQPLQELDILLEEKVVSQKLDDLEILEESLHYLLPKTGCTSSDRENRNKLWGVLAATTITF